MTNSSDEIDWIPVFEVEYGCGNCGASFEERYERDMHVESTSQGCTVNDDSTFGSGKKVTCPVCSLTKCVDVRDRSPIDDNDVEI